MPWGRIFLVIVLIIVPITQVVVSAKIRQWVRKRSEVEA